MGIRFLKLFGIGVATLSATLVLLVLLLMVGLFRQSTASFALWAAGSAAGYEFACEEFEGNILSSSTCRGFSVSDDQGVFFRAQVVELGWQFLPVLTGRLNIDHLRLANAELNREPQGDNNTEASTLPDWPGISIALGELVIQRFVVNLPDAPMVCFNGAGSGEVAEPVLLLDIQIMRCAGEGTVTARTRITGEQIEVDIQAMDDGDLAALVLGWDGAGATNIRIVGAGPFEAFNGILDARIENGGTASLNIGTLVTGDNGINGIGIEGEIALADGRAPDWAPATSGSVSAQVFFGEQGAMRVDGGVLVWGNADLNFDFLRSDAGVLSGQLGANIGPYDGAVTFQSAELTLNLQGNADAQTADGNYIFGQFCAGDICADEIAGGLQLSNQDSVIAFATEGNANALRIIQILDEVFGERTDFNFVGNYALDGNNLDLEGNLQGAQGDLNLNGQLSFADGTSGNAVAQLNINENALVSGTMIPSDLHLSANVEAFTAGGSASGTLGLASDILDASGSFVLSENQALDVVIEATGADPDYLLELTGLVFSAPPVITATVAGTTGLPRVSLQASVPGLDIGGFAFRDAQWTLDAARADTAWTGDMALSSQSSAGNVDLNARLDWPDDAPLEVTVAESQIAEADIVGRFAMPPGDAPATAIFNITGNALSPLGQFLAQPASSAGTMEIRLEGPSDAQNITIDLALEDVSFGEQLTGAALQGDLSYEIAARHAQSNLRLIEGANELNFNANADFSEEISITLSSLEGNWAGTPLRLVEPAFFRQSDATTTLSGAEFAFGNGRAEIAGSRNIDGIAAQISLNAIPVAPFMALQGYPDAQGALNANANVRITPTISQGDLALTLSDFAFANIARELVPADLSLTGDWDGREVVINGEVTGLDEMPSVFSASLPLRRATEGYTVAIQDNALISGRFSGSARAERFISLLPIAEHSLTGLISASLQLDGTPAEPIFTGQARLQDGTYESFELGTRLESVDLTMDAATDGAFNVEANASDGGAGRLSVTGRVSFDENAQPIGNGSVNIANAYMVQRDEYTVRGSGEINFNFPEGKTGSVTGMFRTSEVRVDLGQQLPPGVEQIAVIEINRPAELGALTEVEESAEDNFISLTMLDIEIAMPNNVRVQGYGVEAEWQGNIAVSGTVGAPAISGEINLMRGFAEFLSRQFTLDEGSVVLDTNAAGNARIAITGSHVQDDLSVEIDISGPAASPEIEWSSVPALPRDEIISRLYFGRASPQLTAYEAIQLVQLSGALGGLGGGGGVLGFARRVAGLDVLRIELPENGDIANPTVTVGKYVTDRVYVGARRDADTASSSVEVEVDITPNISAKVETGTTQRRSAGVNWHWDY